MRLILHDLPSEQAQRLLPAPWRTSWGTAR